MSFTNEPLVDINVIGLFDIYISCNLVQTSEYWYELLEYLRNHVLDRRYHYLERKYRTEQYKYIPMSIKLVIGDSLFGEIQFVKWMHNNCDQVYEDTDYLKLYIYLRKHPTESFREAARNFAMFRLNKIGLISLDSI